MVSTLALGDENVTSTIVVGSEMFLASAIAAVDPNESIAASLWCLFGLPVGLLLFFLLAMVMVVKRSLEAGIQTTESSSQTRKIAFLSECNVQ